MGEAPELHEALEALTDAAEAAWPAFRVDRSAFQAHVVSCVEGEMGNQAIAVSRLHTKDLYLAYACSQRVSPALEEFTERYLSRLDTSLKQFSDSSVRPEDVRRELEDGLLFGRNDSPARIGQYTGRGPLERFVKTAARNAAVTLIRGQRHTAASDDFDALASKLAAPPAGSESFVAARYEAVVREALRTALLALDRRQRMIVRLHLLQSVTLTQIARMLQVNQSTVSRALAAAVDVIHGEIRQQLQELEGMNESEMKSVIRDVRHRIDLSLSRILRSTKSGA